jgi:hypothetical protein
MFGRLLMGVAANKRRNELTDGIKPLLTSDFAKMPIENGDPCGSKKIELLKHKSI